MKRNDSQSLEHQRETITAFEAIDTAYLFPIVYLFLRQRARRQSRINSTLEIYREFQLIIVIVRNDRGGF
jgi:hypothetical protein